MVIMEYIEKKYNWSHIGERIKQERLKLKLNQSELMKKIELSPDSYRVLGRWENARKGSHPQFKDMIELCNVFNCELGYLLCEYDCKTRDTVDIKKEIGLSEKAINILEDLKNRQGKSGHNTFMCEIIIEFFNLLIENIELNNGYMFLLASQSIDYIVGLHEQLLFQEEIQKQHNVKMAKDKEFAAQAFSIKNENLDFHSYQLAKYFEDAISYLAKDSKVYDKIKKIYDANFCPPPIYIDKRFEDLLAWRVKDHEIYAFHIAENEKRLENFKKRIESLFDADNNSTAPNRKDPDFEEDNG